jgi:hypothetical protein
VDDFFEKSAFLQILGVTSPRSEAHAFVKGGCQPQKCRRLIML